MTQIFAVLWPELLLVTVGMLLLLLGIVQGTLVRRLAPFAALASLIVVFFALLNHFPSQPASDRWNTLLVYSFQDYIKLITAAVGIVLLLLAWPTNHDATGNPAIQYGHETPEFFGLMLLSLSGILFVASANDIVVMFLGIELASIPTYIMVSISRPLPAAQEAGVKYFFLGAMSAAVMLFGFSYLYGTTGATKFTEIGRLIHLNGPGHDWQLLAVIMLLVGFAFKIAAVPLHTYAGDVYQGAATPVTAFLSFVPKTSGFVAILKVLYYVSQVGAAHWVLPDTISKLMWIIAVLTMTVGNVVGMPQNNIKRTLAYSSISHTGYMLCGVTALVSTTDPKIQASAMGAVLFYLFAYGIMNSGAFGVLTMLPPKESGIAGYLEPARPGDTQSAAAEGTSAETFDDIAGMGRRHIVLGLALAVCLWSLTGLPFTVGFWGKAYLIAPLFQFPSSSPVKARMSWLGVLLLVNAAIAAAYYLRIIAAMFLRGEPHHPHSEAETASTFLWQAAAGRRPWPVVLAIALSVIGTIAFGSDFPSVDRLSRRTRAAQIDVPGGPSSVAGSDARVPAELVTAR